MAKITRTPDVTVDKDFEAYAEVTKSYVDDKTGERHIIGVATGVAEDRDGERVSKNAIVGMGRQIEQGGVKITSSHQQDWMTEIGDVRKYEMDGETDEMIIHGVLPPESVDPIADKAWLTTQREKVGWSIGGKLRKSYFERNELGKKRKVLDAIDLRHIMLTKHPAYQHSFAEAVAKTWDGEPPADEEFTIDGEVEKADTTGSWASGSSDAGGGNVGRDSVGSGKRNAGVKDPKSKGMSTEDDGSQDEDHDDDKDLPKAKDERHLACPNCGHEFAADLPVDPDEQQADNPDNPDKDEDRDTGKSAEKEQLMSTLNETLDALKALAAADDVNKTTEPAEPAAPAAGESVTKTDPEPTDVMKMVAASHKAHEDRFEQLESSLGEAFGLIAKSHKQIVERLEDLPQGRRSTARVLPPAVGHDGDQGVEKTVEKQVEDAPDALTGLKILNKAAYGVQ